MWRQFEHDLEREEAAPPDEDEAFPDLPEPPDARNAKNSNSTQKATAPIPASRRYTASTIAALRLLYLLARTAITIASYMTATTKAAEILNVKL